MCSKLFLTSCFVALIGFGSVHAAPKDTMITKINNLVSTFPTTSQLSKVCFADVAALRASWWATGP